MTVDMLSESKQMFLNDPVWLLQCRLSLQHLRSLSVGISLQKPQTQNDGNGAQALAIASPVLTTFEFATKSFSNNLLDLKATTANSRSLSWSKAFRISYQFNTKQVLLTKKWHCQNSGIQYRKRILHEKQTLAWIIQYITQQPRMYKANNTLIKYLIASIISTL